MPFAEFRPKKHIYWECYDLILMISFVIFQIETVKKHRNIWVENADRLVAGFLEMFEEGCHRMVMHLSYPSSLDTNIKYKIFTSIDLILRR